MPAPWTESDLLEYFEAHGLDYSLHRHPALHTVEQSQELRGELTGGHCKNMFLKTKVGDLYLVTCLENRKIRIKDLEKVIGAKRLSFASPDRLFDHLGVTPGAVTPFALVNDPNHAVQLILDQQMLTHDLLNYHPLHNEATIAMSQPDVLRFFELTQHTPKVVDFDALEQLAVA